MRVLSGFSFLVTAAGSLDVLAEDPSPDAAAWLLTGKNYFMSGDYRKAIEFCEKALAISPASSEYELWLGRAWGRRAETGSWLMAASHASRARQCFEKAVALDPHNREAKNDLFDFYLNAPGFLGGGIEKAEAAEAHLRCAMELAPTEAGRVVDLARYLAKRGRLKESDLLFEQAGKMAPGQPRIAFAEASANIENHRGTERARALLEPDDPPRQEAEKLLRRAGGSAE